MDSKREELLREEWESWRHHPVTSQLIHVFEGYRETFIRKLSNSATNLDLDSQHFKNLAVGLRNMDTVLLITTDFNFFKQQLEPNKE